MKKTISYLLVILFIQNTFSQNDKSLIKYIQNEYNFKIGDSIPDKILKETNITIKGIQINDLRILKIFQKLHFLTLYQCKVNDIKNIPEQVEILTIENGTVTQQLIVPSSVKKFCYVYNKTNYVPILTKGLEYLDFTNNNIDTLNELPDGLTYFSCSQNNIKVIPKLPNSLVDFDCSRNSISELPLLPPNLKTLNCGFNKIKEIRNIPRSLGKMECQANEIEKMDSIHSMYFDLDIRCNPIKKLPIDFKNCASLNINPGYYYPSGNDYRNLWMQKDFKCRDDLKDFCSNIYQSLIYCDYNLLGSQFISNNDFEWIEKYIKGDSLKRISEFNKLLKDKESNEEIKFNLLSISTGIGFLDSVGVIKDDLYNSYSLLSVLPSEYIVFYFSNFMNEPYRTLNLNIIRSPHGYKLFKFPVNLSHIKQKENYLTNQDELPNEMPDDFNFAINSDSYNYNSQRELYSKALTRYPTILNVSISNREKKKIYNKLKKIDFDKIPKESSGLIQVNESTITVTVNIKGKIKKINSCYSANRENDYCKQVQEVIKQINDILRHKRKVKNAPQIYYMRI